MTSLASAKLRMIYLGPHRARVKPALSRAEGSWLGWFEGHTLCARPRPVNGDNGSCLTRSLRQADGNPGRHLEFRTGTLYVANSMQLTFFSYRFAAEVLDSPEFIDKKNDIIQIFTNLKVPQLPKPKQRPRAPGMTFTTDQKALNVALNNRFKEKEWECQPFVTNDRVTKIKADYKKGRVQVEVQFGNMARWYTDVFKFQVSYSLGIIDVGVLVVPMQAFANTIDENVAHYERVTRELPYAKMSLTLPIWVIGIRP